MTSKSKTLKYSTSKKDVDYTLYKYSEIQIQWIICQGHLNYRSVQFKLLNISQFAMYYVVLAKIPIEDEKEIRGIYLYRNQKHKPSNFFQLNEYEKISDHCSKPIKSSYYLFELVGKDPTDIEIFGANDASEREKWIKHIQQELNWTQLNFIPNDLPIIHHVRRRSWKESSKTRENIDDADVRNNYEPFTEKRRSSSIAPHSIFPLPHRLAAIVSGEQPLDLNENKQTTDNVYLDVKSISQCLIKEDNDQSKTVPVKPLEEETPLEDKPFTWNDIFYANEQDDHARVLNNICQIGAFLIRPQSKKVNSSDHDYTLSIYAFGGIIKYRILKFSNDKYSLVTNMSQPSFDNIPDLCRYYITHQLPRSTLRDDLAREAVGNLCLKWPYTYYLNYSNTF